MSDRRKRSASNNEGNGNRVKARKHGSIVVDSAKVTSKLPISETDVLCGGGSVAQSKIQESVSASADKLPSKISEIETASTSSYSEVQPEVQEVILTEEQSKTETIESTGDMPDEKSVNKELGQRDISEIASKIGSEWKRIGIEMGFSTVQLEHFEERFKLSIHDRTFSMIEKWCKAVNPITDNPRRLLAHFISKTDNNLLASQIDSNFKDIQIPEHLDSEVQKIVLREEQHETVPYERSSGNIQEQYECTLQSWRDLDEIYLETRASKFAMTSLNKHGTLTVIGPPGEGKSVTAHHIALKYQSMGYIVIPCRDVKEIERICNPQTKQLFVVDDPLGSHCLEKDRLSDWVTKSENIKNCSEKGLTKIIATIRKEIYQYSRQIKKTIFAKNCVDLSADDLQLDSCERESMLKIHCKDVSIDSKKLSEVVNSSYFPGFPLLCHLLKIDEKSRTEIGSELNPASVMLNQIEVIAEENKEQYCALVLTAMFGGSFDPEDLDSVTDSDMKDEPNVQQMKQIIKTCGLKPNPENLETISSSFEHLKGVYFLKRDGEFYFLHDVIFSAIAYHYGNKHIMVILKHCSSKFIRERVRVKDLKKTDTSEHDYTMLTIDIPEKKYLDFSKRLTRDLLEKNHIDVFQNPSVHDSEFQKIWTKHLLGLSRDSLLELLSMEPVTETETDDVLKNLQKTLDFAIISSTPIHWLCRYGMLDMLQKLLSQFEEPNLILNKLPGHTQPLHFASGYGHLDLVKYLVKLGQDVNSKSCLEKEQIEKTAVAEYYTGFTPLFYAARENHLEVVEYLLQNGAKPNLVRDHGASPILLTADRGHDKVVKTLIEHGADPNLCCDHGTSPLILAASENHYETAKVLIDNGAELDIKKYENGVSAVYFAAMRGHSKTLTLLLQNRANPDLCNIDNVTPLAAAINGGHLQTAELLLENRADVNLNDKNNNSPLLHALKRKYQTCESNMSSETEDVHYKRYNSFIQLLLDKGASPVTENKDGDSPAAMAVAQNDTEMIRMFDSAKNKTHKV